MNAKQGERRSDHEVGVMSGNPKHEPMHYGEIFGVWSYTSKAKAMVDGLQTSESHAGDDDLKSLLKDLRQETMKEIKECEELLKDNGVATPPTFAEKPKAKWEDIPVGARFTDPEIALGVSDDLAIGLVLCSEIIGESVREDIGAMFAKYHTTKVANALRMLRMNKDKGWLIPPPLQVKTPEPVNV